MQVFERIVKHRKRGETIAAFCVRIGIHPSTYYKWKDTRPDFEKLKSVAKRLGIPFGEIKGSGSRQGNYRWYMKIFDDIHKQLDHTEVVLWELEQLPGRSRELQLPEQRLHEATHALVQTFQQDIVIPVLATIRKYRVEHDIPYFTNEELTSG